MSERYRSSKSKRFGIMLVSVAALWAGAGCGWFKERVQAKPDASTRAILAAARTRQISMFGDVPNGPTQSYFTRTALSLRQHTFSEVGRDLGSDIDGTGRYMAFASTRHNVQPDLYIKAIDGVAVTQLTSDPASDLHPEFSPDGSRIAFSSDRSGNWDIWVMERRGGVPIQVTSGAGDEIHPSWSPDGTQIVYCSLPVRGGQWELWVTDTTGGFGRRFVGYGLFPEWSPVEDTIVYQRARDRGGRLFGVWTLTLVDGEPRYPTELAASAIEAMILPTWSSDGRRIAFAATNVTAAPVDEVSPGRSAQASDIWVMGSDGRGKVRLTDGYTANYAPVFGVDGRIFFTSDRSGHESLWSLIPASASGVKNPDSSVTQRVIGTEGETQIPVQTAADKEDS